MNIKELRERMAALIRAGAQDGDEVKLVVRHERGQRYTYDITTVEYTENAVKFIGGIYKIG